MLISPTGVPPMAAELAHRRQRGESIAEALHPPALVVDADQQLRLAQRADLLRQGMQLLGALEIAAEEDHAARGGMQHPPSVVVGQRGPDGVEDGGAERRLQPSHSRITVAAAMSRSSVSVRWERRMPRARS